MESTTRTEKAVKYGCEKQLGEEGETVFCWYFCTLDAAGNADGDEPIAGGFCATEADCRNDASAWLAMHPEYAEKLTRWRVVAKMPLLAEPMVDWFSAVDAAGAIAQWRDLAAEIGLPNRDRAIVSASDGRDSAEQLSGM